jgi:hypothetical protein
VSARTPPRPRTGRRRPRALLAAAVLLLASAAAPLEAQQEQQPSEADIFNAQTFDQSVAESRQQEQANRLEYLVGGVFLLDSSILTAERFDGYTAAGAFSSKAFVRLTVPSYGALYLGYILRHTLYQGDGGVLDTGSSPAMGADLFENTFELSEFYLSFDLSKKVFFRVGNQLLAWGPAFIWTPVDFVNLQRLDPLASVDLRVGKPGLRVHVPMKNSNLFLFADFSRTVDTDPLALDTTDLARTALAARWDLTALGFEFGLSGYFGRDLPGHFGLDFSGRLLGFDVYGEAALTANFPSETQDYAVSAGLQRSFGDLKEWSVQAEAYYQSAGQPSTPFYEGQWYAFAALTKQKLLADFLDVTLSGFLNASDLSYLLRLAAAFDPAGVIPFTFTVGYAGGGAGKEFTAYSGGNAFSASLQVRFEF